MSAGARVLVIDDEAPIRRFLRIALEAEGHGVIEAATAREGIAAIARETPALVILDLGLPDADGLSVLAEIRGWSAVPVIVLSVRSDEAGKVAALDAGAQDYVVKPFGVKELLARIRGLLRDRGGPAAPARCPSGAASMPGTFSMRHHQAPDCTTLRLATDQRSRGSSAPRRRPARLCGWHGMPPMRPSTHPRQRRPLKVRASLHTGAGARRPSSTIRCMAVA